LNPPTGTGTAGDGSLLRKSEAVTFPEATAPHAGREGCGGGGVCEVVVRVFPTIVPHGRVPPLRPSNGIRVWNLRSCDRHHEGGCRRPFFEHRKLLARGVGLDFPTQQIRPANTFWGFCYSPSGHSPVLCLPALGMYTTAAAFCGRQPGLGRLAPGRGFARWRRSATPPPPTCSLRASPARPPPPRGSSSKPLPQAAPWTSSSSATTSPSSPPP